MIGMGESVIRLEQYCGRLVLQYVFENNAPFFIVLDCLIEFAQLVISVSEVRKRPPIVSRELPQLSFRELLRSSCMRLQCIQLFLEVFECFLCLIEVFTSRRLQPDAD